MLKRLSKIVDKDHHWFTVQVSNKEGNNYVLDEERILYFLEEVLDFNIK